MKTGFVSDVGRASLALLLLTMTSAAWPDWRQPDAANLLYMQLPHGAVVMELAPGLAPKNIANIRLLAREKYFDGLAIIRSQDNYVVQWGDPADNDDEARSLGSAATKVPPEFDHPSNELRMTTIESRDAYADIVGFVDGFPAASDGKTAWLTHCYGMVGVAPASRPQHYARGPRAIRNRESHDTAEGKGRDGILRIR